MIESLSIRAHMTHSFIIQFFTYECGFPSYQGSPNLIHLFIVTKKREKNSKNPENKKKKKKELPFAMTFSFEEIEV